MTKLIQGIIIGGSPSTGSSLLRQILNRHTGIVCAPETHIWCKEKIFDYWAGNKNKLLKKSIFGLLSEGLPHFVGIDKSQIPKFDKKTVQKYIDNSPDIYTFFRHIMMEYFDLRAGQLYGEKTPANTINFKKILDSSRDIMCIHTVRDPYDTIASLVARGKAPIDATALYLYNCAHGLNYRMDSRLETIRYEALVEDPQLELSRVLEKLNLSFEGGMLNGGDKKEDEVTKIASWNYDETDKVQKGSVGRFNSLSQAVQDEIVLYVWHLHLKDDQAPRLKSIKETNEKLLYRTIKPKMSLTEEHFKEWKRHRKRTITLFNNFDLQNFPLYLK